MSRKSKFRNKCFSSVENSNFEYSHALKNLTIRNDLFTVARPQRKLTNGWAVYSKCNASYKKWLIIPMTAHQPTFHIIREVYDSGNAHESFEAELEKALEAKVDYIIIEPTRLGDETSSWIAVGNCLHKTAVVSGLASIISGILWQDRPLFSAPMCAVSVFCTGLYTVSWNYDPCCQYQVENDSAKLSKLPLADVSSPVVLGYSENTKTKYFHRGVTLLSAAFCAWQIYKAYK